MQCILATMNFDLPFGTISVGKRTRTPIADTFDISERRRNVDLTNATNLHSKNAFVYAFNSLLFSTVSNPVDKWFVSIGVGGVHKVTISLSE